MSGHQDSDDTGRDLPSPANRRWRRTSTHQLTPAERRVLDEALRGGTTRDVALALFVTEATVRTHLTRIYEKVGVRGRIELLATCRAEPALAPAGCATAPYVPVLAPRAALSDYVWICLYVGGLLAADGLLVYLTPLSALLGPTLIAAHVVSTRSGAASRPVRLAVLTAGILLSAQQITILVALRML